MLIVERCGLQGLVGVSVEEAEGDVRDGIVGLSGE